MMKAGKVPYAKNVGRENYPKNMPQWQIDILEGALQYRIISSIGGFGPDMIASRMDVFGMIYNMRFSGTKMEYNTNTITPPLSSAPEPINSLPENNSTTTPPITTKNELAGFAVTIPSDI
jgi:hypothetical protein